MNKVQVLVLSLLFSALGHGEEVRAVRFPGGVASWTVAVEEKASDQQKAAFDTIVRVESFQSDHVRCDKTFWSSGATSERWVIDGYVLQEQTNGGSIEISKVGVDRAQPLSPRFAGFDQETFAWSKEASRVSLEKLNGIECIVFEKAKGQDMAFANALSGLPVEYRTAWAVYRFKFDESPKALPVMPAKFVEKLERVKNANKKPVILNGAL